MTILILVHPFWRVQCNYRLKNCVADLQVWFNENQMIMNDDKTEFIPFVPKRYDNLIEHSSIIVGKNKITASSTVTNLGVVLDRNLTMAYHCLKLCEYVHINYA